MGWSGEKSEASEKTKELFRICISEEAAYIKCIPMKFAKKNMKMTERFFSSNWLSRFFQSE